MFKYDLVWNKILTSGFLNAKRQPLRLHEQIAIFYKKQPTYNPQMEVGEPSHSKGNKYKEKDVTNNNYGKINAVETDSESNLKYPKSIITFQKPHPSKALHRTEKSVECIEYLIKTYTNEGEVVLDNCAGSFTTAIACLNMNRKFICIEKDEKYFEIGKNRIIEKLKMLNRIDYLNEIDIFA
jgi:site-specific DNA-methyltransferase (adenine-specific)